VLGLALDLALGLALGLWLGLVLGLALDLALGLALVLQASFAYNNCHCTEAKPAEIPPSSNPVKQIQKESYPLKTHHSISWLRNHVMKNMTRSRVTLNHD